jgi:hypothetical protein
VTTKCPPPDPDCLWRVSGFSKALRKPVRHVGLVRAPDSDAALRLAVALYGSRYSDLTVGETPLATL